MFNSLIMLQSYVYTKYYMMSYVCMCMRVNRYPFQCVIPYLVAHYSTTTYLYCNSILYRRCYISVCYCRTSITMVQIRYESRSRHATDEKCDEKQKSDMKT